MAGRTGLARLPRATSGRARGGARRNAGFTLIEIMVAMTILVVLTGGLYVCFVSVADTAEIARTSTEELRARQYLWNHFRDHLGAIAPNPAGEYALVGEDDSGPYGDADTLRFTSVLPMSGAKSLPGMVKTVEYFIDDPSFEDPGGFRTFEGEGAPEVTEKEGVTLFIVEKPLVLLGGGEGDLFSAEYVNEEEVREWQREVPIRSINFEYYDGNAEEWVESWNSDETGLLPWAVRVQLNLAKTADQLEAEWAEGIDPQEDFDLESVIMLPAGAGVLGDYLDPNRYRLTDQEAEEAGAE